MRASIIAIAALLACQRSAAPAADAEYAKSVDGWHQGRVARLTSDTGWLTVSGLLWLKEGANRAGTAEENDVRFPAGAPPHLGTFDRNGNEVRFTAAPGAEVTLDGKPVVKLTLMTDAGGAPTMLKTGTQTFFVIQRGQKLGVRVRDTEAKARKQFHGIERWPVEPRYRVEAKWETFETPRQLSVPNIIGTVEPMESPGAAVFELDGQKLRLQPVLEPPSKELFFIFADATSGKESYGAGRFLYAKPAENGKVTLDFNKAYNPPCAFTAFATCPLPPEGNRLAIAVRAGEKNYGHH
jgi:uncharacterized protein (DUF1684 family)